jgi:hypothetical protein
MTIGERLRSRVLGLDQRWIDLALAGTVALWFTIELLTRDPQGTDRAATAATGLVVIAALVLRTRHLALACVLFAAAVLAQQPLEGGFMDTWTRRSPRCSRCSTRSVAGPTGG